MTNHEQEYKKIKEAIEDYDETVFALKGFTACTLHDGQIQIPNSKYEFGRRMTTSNNNPIQPSSNITPDLVIFISSEYGIIGEVKKSLNLDSTFWVKHIEQLRKYDDDLTGWWTNNKKIINSDTVILIHTSRSREFKDFFENYISTNKLVTHSISIIEFTKVDQSNNFIFFRLESGNIKFKKLKDKLYHGVSVNLEDILSFIPNLKYYDHEPPVIYVMEQLWMDLFPSLKNEYLWDDEKRAFLIKISVSWVTNEIYKAYGSGRFYHDSRTQTFPRRKWIHNAFKKFEALKLAIPPDEGSDKYTILYKPFRKDIRDRFIRNDVKLSLKKITKVKESNRQLNLLDPRRT